jgi:TubC N-terminal docking domain
MTATEIKEACASRGIWLSARGPQLEVRPASALTDGLRCEIRQRKSELLALLEAEQQPPTPVAQPEPAQRPRARRQKPVLPPRGTQVQIATAKDGEHTVFEIQTGGKRISDAGWFVGPQWAQQYAREKGWKVIESQNTRGGNK